MAYTILQIPGDQPNVLDALGSVGSGTPNPAGVEHSRGWTSVRMEDDAAAARYAPLLVQLLGVPALVWSVDDDRCHVTFHRPHAEPLEAIDQGEDVDRLAQAFRDSLSTIAPQDDQTTARQLVPGTPQYRHRAIAERLRIPYVVPDQPAQPSQVRPSLSETSLPLGAQDFRRREKIRNARSWLHFASGFGLVAIILLVIRGPWIGIPIALAVIGVLQLVRFLLGRSLPPETPAS